MTKRKRDDWHVSSGTGPTGPGGKFEYTVRIEDGDGNRVTFGAVAAWEVAKAVEYHAGRRVKVKVVER